MQCYGFLQTSCVSCRIFSDQTLVALRSINPRQCACRIQSSRIMLSRTRDDLFLSKMFGASPNSRRLKDSGRKRATIFVPQAASEISQDFNLDGGGILKIKTGVQKDGGPAYVEFQVHNTHTTSLFLHWGALKANDGKWRLPSHRPPGTRDFNNTALQSPFVTSGDVNTLKVEVPDKELKTIEFLLRDDATDRWFKLNGKNFRLDIPHSQVYIPEDLIALQAFINWEKKGKKNYTPEQEKSEYEDARKKLQEEVANGATIESVRAKLKGSNSAPPKPASRGSGGRISRKQRDFGELINKYTGKTEESTPVSATPRETSKLESALSQMAEEAGDAVLFKKVFKLGNKELMTIATKVDGNVRVTIATDFEEPVAIHWSLSQDNPREWKRPPAELHPPGSEDMKEAVDSPCEGEFGGDTSLQSLEIDLGKGKFLGMPFVVRAGSNWIKLNDSDFYIPLQPSEKKEAKGNLDGSGTAKWLLDEMASLESEAERSLMHRYNIMADLLQRSKDGGELVIAGFLVWLRYMAMRQLTWNKNYNVKPREISAAQDRLTDLLQAIYVEQPHNRELVRLTLSTVGRGAQGDVGQRIRDEILVIQRNNDCKGGMMEEWHQKLHNNTSPDDVVICQALLDYISSDFNIDVYWKTLNDNGVTKERLASYDRPIVSEPRLRRDQKDGLLRDLKAYMRSLKAVHSGADLESAISTCMGYSSEGHDFMKTIDVHPISGLSPALPELLRFVMQHVEDRDVLPLLEGLLESRRELLPTLQKPHNRLKDIIFLDLALDSTVRTAVERGLEGLSKASPSDMMLIICLVLENLCLSSDSNEELVYCLKDWYNIIKLCNSKAENWALQAKSVLDRTRLVLGDKVEHYQKVLQPTAEYLGISFGVEQWAMEIFTEEMIRAGSAASLSVLLNRLDPVLRSTAHLGSWQVISPVNVQGFVSVVHELGDVQDKVYDKPTILISGRVKGEEEIPDGAVAVLTPDMPDVLSHVSVRARNSKVLFATCFDPNILTDLRSLEGKALKLQLTASSEIVYSKVSDTELSGDVAAAVEEEPPHIVLKTKRFMGKYAVTADEFTPELVGAKSLNTANLRGKLPSWIKLPTYVALPFGVFEEVLSNSINKEVSAEVERLKKPLLGGDLSKLKEIRDTILKLKAPPELVEELKTTMINFNMPWPGNEGEHRWEQAWMAIRRVWASKWNERAFISTRKAKIDHEHLRMAVLVQQIICADYAFVIHTTNPSNGNASEIYAEVVKGLGETLVGAYQGRALSFVTQKSDLKNPKILGFPSKRHGLFIKPSVIFRSDSNGEDLEGYAGAGLYDSVPMDREEERVVDYSTDKLLLDASFQKTILSNIASAGAEIERVYGTPQDIEGCIKDGELYVVQTRPQM
ncbi:alpha-glucan water dikinase 1, chloroplastic [Selaginella moellendorffii]|uniref:alpha-glucan water dikinase 1, chloroplastic n=1 Tax=Selaginella moellendorffii TaxID=88036 RepID=UPI000D1C8B1D|nr:alpha-glucan water dikinase 1, chloroplastic [Selaginella moellendorffii]|eukprot:XP_024543149.1 alpha-glucan water dikinase 1, chloroplastic [Selaginella moellendorffii]